MPRFLYLVIVVNILSLVGLIFAVFKLTPDIAANRFVFLGLLLVTLTILLSIIFYQIGALRKSLFTEPRYLYRKMLRRGFLVSLAVTIPLGLKFWGAANKLSILLLIVFLGVLEAYFSYRK